MTTLSCYQSVTHRNFYHSCGISFASHAIRYVYCCVSWGVWTHDLLVTPMCLDFSFNVWANIPREMDWLKLSFPNWNPNPPSSSYNPKSMIHKGIIWKPITWILWSFKAGWSKAGCFLMSMQSIISPSSLYKHERKILLSIKIN